MFKNPPPSGHNKSSVSSQRSLKYRPDIDGLRAIAVLSVVLFHAFPDSIFRSGFAGVDIFFVISGFLISTIIFRGMNERMSGTGSGKPFSFIDFYSRRVRRIFPSSSSASSPSSCSDALCCSRTSTASSGSTPREPRPMSRTSSSGLRQETTSRPRHRRSLTSTSGSSASRSSSTSYGRSCSSSRTSSGSISSPLHS